MALRVFCLALTLSGCQGLFALNTSPSTGSGTHDGDASSGAKHGWRSHSSNGHVANSDVGFDRLELRKVDARCRRQCSTRRDEGWPSRCDHRERIECDVCVRSRHTACVLVSRRNRRCCALRNSVGPSRMTYSPLVSLFVAPPDAIVSSGPCMSNSSHSMTDPASVGTVITRLAEHDSLRCLSTFCSRRVSIDRGMQFRQRLHSVRRTVHRTHVDTADSDLYRRN